MSEQTETIAEFELPYRRKATLKLASFDSGMQMLRLVLREGMRITQVDLDAETARKMASVMNEYADRNA